MARENERHKLAALREETLAAGGVQKINEQHQKGRMSARERISFLFDADSFVELDQFVSHRSVNHGMNQAFAPGDGVVTGYGTIDGRLVYAYAQDSTILGGSMGEMHAAKICKVIDMAVKTGAPIVGLLDSGGARIQEAIDALNAYGEIYRRSALASGVVPQLSVVMGDCIGSAAFIPAMSDFTIVVEKSAMFLHGPQVTKSIEGKDVTAEQLGGAEANSLNGNAQFYAANDQDALQQLRRLLAFLPDNNLSCPPAYDCDDPAERADAVLSELPLENSPYDMRDVITAVADNGDFMEVQSSWAASMLAGFIRLNGLTVGIIANQPNYAEGEIDICACDKAARFIRFCDAYAIPMLTFVDTPGFTVGLDQEQGGIARHSAKMITAYAEATVPKLTVVIGKAYGNAYLSMCSKSLGADMVLAWPSAQISIMQPEGAVNIIYQQDINEAANPQQKRQELLNEYCDAFAGPFAAAKRGLVDIVAEPELTRYYVVKALDALITKKESRPGKKHAILPC